MTALRSADIVPGWKRGVGLVALSAITSGILVSVPAFSAAYLPIAVGAILLVGLVRVLVPGPPPARRSLLRWTLGGLALHVVTSVVMTAIFPLRDDALYYHYSARAVVDHWEQGSALPSFFPGKFWYVYLLAGLYRVVGSYPAAGLAMNAVFAAAVLPLITDATERLFGVRPSRYASVLVLLFPGFLVWTSMLNREAIVLFLVAVVVNAVVRLAVRVTAGPLVAYSAALPALAGFRTLTALTMGVGTLVGLGVAARGPLVRAATVASLPLLLMAVVVWHSGEDRGLLPVTAAQVDAVRALDATSSRSAIDPGADTSTPARATAFILVHLPEAFAGPFPWHMRAVRHVLALPDTAVWWCLLPSLFVGLRTALAQVGSRLLLLAAPALATQLAVTYVIGDFGTLLRQRPQVVLPLMPLIALGLARQFSASDESDPSRTQAAAQ